MFSENPNKRKGLASELVIECQCGYKSEFYTSKSNFRQSFYLNKRIVYTMRSMGQGYNGIKKFTALMDMSYPITKNNYDKIANNITTVVKSVAEMTIRDACNEIKHKINPDDCSKTADTAVSIDGTWQKRGYSSFNGVVTAISMDSGKIFDSVPLTRYCKSCKLAENFRVSNPDRYDRWRVEHNCRQNHSGSAGSMEVECAKTIFGRSIEKNGLHYAEYFGDGDSKGYMEVKNTYEGITVKNKNVWGTYRNVSIIGCVD